MNLYALRDLKAGFNNAPFPAVNHAIAIRTIENALKDKNLFSLNPEDFELYFLGTLNEDTGVFESNLTHLINCTDLINKNVA